MSQPSRPFAWVRVLALIPWVGPSVPGLSACDGDEVARDRDVDGDGADLAPDTAAPVTSYYRDIAPLLAQHCTTCHAPGLAGPFRLDTLEDARRFAELGLGAMQVGLMPPWMPDRACRTYADERGVSAAEVGLLARWIAEGKPAGDPAELPSLPTPPAWEPNLILPISQSYLPTGDIEDDYRCFVLGDASLFGADTYLSASQVSPGSSQVHHVLVYAIAPEHAAELTALDAAAEGPGYPCFGGPLPSGAESDLTDFFLGGPVPDLTLPTQIGSWVPGSQPRRYPEGTAIRIRAGSLLVAQVHYNLSEGRPLPDSSRIEMAVTEREPTTLVDVRPLAVRSLDIPAGEPRATNVGWFPYFGEAPLTLSSVTGHMHLLGRRFLAEVVREGAATEPECALSIPRWDFHWQQSYVLRAEDRITLNDGDGVRVTCEHDNSAANQPLVGGVRAAPVDVTWGEGTRDEMCILYYSALKPFTPVAPPQTSLCGLAAPCVERCGSASLDCVMSCPEATPSCQLCTLRAGLSCSSFACVGVLRAAGECLGRCLGAAVMLGSNAGRCLESECGGAYADLLACMDAPLVEGGCGAELAQCGVAF